MIDSIFNKYPDSISGKDLLASIADWIVVKSPLPSFATTKSYLTFQLFVYKK